MDEIKLHSWPEVSSGIVQSQMSDALAHPRLHAQRFPDKVAVLFEDGCSLTFGELERRANQVAHLLRARKVRTGDAIGIFLENEPAFFEIVWGCQRAGVFFVPISTKLTRDELAYILTDSDAKFLFASGTLEETARLACAAARIADPILTGSTYESVRDDQPAVPVPDEHPGTDMVYSSGTTGLPKGVKPSLPNGAVEAENRMTQSLRGNYSVSASSIYLNPAPLYHAAPLRWCMTTQRLGATTIIMRRFDAEAVLRTIASKAVTHAQFVPTHFSRLLSLPSEVRERYNHASLRVVVHAAAPCPRLVKEAMMQWWGPIIFEYYGGSEGNGVTIASPSEWLERPGTVGKAAGCKVEICGEDGEPLPRGETGLVYFAGGAEFEYHKDPHKTAESRNRYGWSTLGDIGHLDADDFLFLTDRRSFTIISGGVNIYPQEIEDVLLSHPGVADAAVVAAPHPDLGEQVAAVIEPREWESAGPEFALDVSQFLGERLSRVKLPRQIDFIREMPRLPTGKLMKRHLRDAYLGARPDVALLLRTGLKR